MRPVSDSLMNLMLSAANGVHVGMVNDEREQTLNALSVNMDGFEPNTGLSSWPLLPS